MMEIERKFLIHGTPWANYACTKHHIYQYYLSVDPVTVRIRVKDNLAFFSTKGPRDGLSRHEHEYRTFMSCAESMVDMRIGSIVTKTRYVLVDEHGQQWDIDEYHGELQGLVVAEIEIPSEQAQVTLPQWIKKEVSLDNRYSNVHLALHGLPT